MKIDLVAKRCVMDFWWEVSEKKLFLKPQLTFQDGVGVPLASLQVKFPIQLVTDLKPGFRGFFYLSIEKWALKSSAYLYFFLIFGSYSI